MAKKLAASILPFQVLEGFIGTQNKNNVSIPVRAFLENPRTLGHVMEIFVSAIFIMLQKNAFGKKKFQFHARVQKCHFGNFSILPKWHF